MLDRIDQFNIADGVGCSLYGGSNLFIAFRSDSHGPLEFSTYTQCAFPCWVRLGKKLTPGISRATPVRTVNHNNIRIRQVRIFIRAADLRVVPSSNPAKI